MKTVRQRRPDGTTHMAVEPRKSASAVKITVRAFYLDLAEWALEQKLAAMRDLAARHTTVHLEYCHGRSRAGSGSPRRLKWLTAARVWCNVRHWCWSRTVAVS